MPIDENSDKRHSVLRFQVSVDQEHVDAFISHAVCQAIDEQSNNVLSLVDFYRQHRPTLEKIVAGKVRAGARKPVVVTALDLW